MAQSSGTNKLASTSDLKKRRCTVIRAQRLAALESPLHCRPSAETAGRRCLLPGSRPRSHRSKGVWELRMVGCTSAAGPKPKPHPGLRRDPAPVAWHPCGHYGGAGVSVPLWEVGTGVPLKDVPGRVRWTRHSPRGNAPCSLRRRKGDNDGLILQRQASVAQAGG